MNKRSCSVPLNTWLNISETLLNRKVLRVCVYMAVWTLVHVKLVWQNFVIVWFVILLHFSFMLFLKANVLIVTDVAARGVDIPLLDNVINLHFPPKPKMFVH